MQIVIKIDEEYKDYFIEKYPNTIMALALKDGIVLPKDHGRLIDADAFIKNATEVSCEDCNRRRGMKNGKLTKKFVYEIGDAPCRACDIGDMIDCVDAAEVVIPADEEDMKL